MSTRTWVAAGSGNWSNGANWSGGVEPGAGDVALIGGAAAYTVTLDVADMVQAITLSDPAAVFDVQQSLGVTGVLAVTAGTFVLDGGSVNGGTLAIANGATATINAGTLNGVAVQGTLSLQSHSNAFTLTGGTSFAGVGGSGAGTINFTGGSFQDSYLYVLGSNTLANATLNIGAQQYGYNRLYNQDTGSGGAVLTLASTFTINQTGGEAAIGSSGGAGDAIVNKGTINANYSGGSFVINATNFTNSGSILVSGGDVLDLQGTISTALINGITVGSGGLIGIDGVVNGGTIASPTGGVGSAGTAGTLNGVAVQGTLSLQSHSNAFTLTGGTSFAGVGGSGAGSINFAGGSFQDSYLYVLGSNTLANATLNIGAQQYGYNYLYNQDTGSGGAVLTLASTFTINQTGGYAAIGTSGGVGDAIVNKGTINANYSGGSFRLNATNFTNSGSIVVSGGDVLDLQGTISTALINGITVGSGGLIGIDGVVNGGAIASPTGGVGSAGTAGTLNGVAVQGTLSLQSNSNAFTLTGGTSFAGLGGSGAGTINFAGGSFQNSYLYVLGSNTLANATLNIGAQQYGYNYLYNQDTGSGGAVLTLASTFTINQTGGYAAIGSSGGAGDAIVNKGTINANYSGGSFVINATNFTNSGSILVSGGDVLDLQGTISTALINGITVGSGGLSGIDGVVNGGTINSAGGVGSTGTAGTLNGVAVHGTLSLQSNAFTLAGGTSFAGAGGSGAGTINFAGGSFQNSYLYVLGSNTLANATLNIGHQYGSNYLYNEDTGGGGAVLTLASSFTISQTGGYAAISGSNATGDSVVNNGTIIANYNGGTFEISPLSFTNNGVLSVSNGDIITLSATFTNLSGATLTGGTYIVGAAGTLQLANDTQIGTLKANVTLSGTNSVIESLNTTTSAQVAIDSTLGTIAAGGTLSLLAGRSLTTTNALSDQGRLVLSGGTLATAGLSVLNAGVLVGTGTVASAVANSTSIEAQAGTLTITGAVTGAGTLQIDANGTLALQGSVAAGATVKYNGAHAILQLGAAGSFAATLGNFAASDEITLGSLVATSAVISGSTLTVGISGGSPLAIPLSGSFANERVGISGGGHVLTAYRYAGASHTPEPLALGNVHVGATASGAVSLTNTATADGYSEKLDASVGTLGGAVTASGTVSRLAAGATAGNAIAVSLVTGAAGAVAGTVTLNLSTDGSGTDGAAALSIGTQTVNVTGGVYAYAVGSVTGGTTVALGNHHVGDTVSSVVTLANTAPASAYSEALDASLGSPGQGITASGSVTGIAAGGSNGTALHVGLQTGAAGAIGGIASLALTSDGAGIDGLGTTALASQTLTVTGAVYNYAAGTLARSTINFGNHHVGDLVSTALTLTNSAATGSYSEALDASLSGASPGAFASGAANGIAAGASNGTGLLVGLNTGTAGAISGTATLALTSDGTGIDGLASTTLGSQTVTVTGAVFNYATATLAGALNFGVVHVGQAVSQALGLTNSGVSGYSTEALDASFGGVGSNLTASGSVTGLLAGNTDATHLLVGLGTGASGTVSDSVVVTLTSDGSGIDGLGNSVLAGQTVNVTGTVDNYAVAAFEDPAGPAITGSGSNFVLNLGTVAQGGTALSATLGVLNAATGLADLLGGSISTVGGAGFSNGGFGSFGGLGAGQDEHLQTVTLGTSAAGTFSETVVVNATGSNASGYSGPLTAETLTVTGTVVGGQTYTLTTGVDSVTGTTYGDTIIATTGALSAGDKIDGAGGTNTLVLQGGGTFNEAPPTTLANVQVVQAQEGSGANAQTLVLRSGLTQTVNVGSGGAGTGITIYAGANGSTINLGSGADSVFLGSTSQHVLGGGGADHFNVTAATIGATIDGGTGASVLALSGGGTATMGASITRVASATLGGTTPYNFTANAIAGLTINDGGGANTITLGAATQVVNAQGGAMHVLATAAFAAAKVLGATGSVLEITTGGTATLNQNTGGVTVQLDAATNLTLSKASFITAIGSAGNDGITALAANQTLTGGAGTDTLVGFTGGNDTFRDSTAGLSGDTITSWVSGDTIDLTDMSYASVQPLSYGSSKLTVTDGTHTASVGFTGSLATHNFTLLGADSGGGTLIGWHA